MICKFQEFADDTVISLIREGKKSACRWEVRTTSTWVQAPPSLSSTTDCNSAVDTFQDPGSHHLPGLGHLTWTPSSKMPSRRCSSCRSHNVLPASGAFDPLQLCSATKQDRHRLEGTIRMADRFPGAKPPSVQFLFSSRVMNRAVNVTTDPYLFSLLPSGGRYSSLYTCRTRHNSFTLQALTLTNTWIYPPSNHLSIIQLSCCKTYKHIFVHYIGTGKVWTPIPNPGNPCHCPRNIHCTVVYTVVVINQ